MTVRSWTLANLKVDGVEGVDYSSVAMLSFHLEGQSNSDHVQRVSAYHCSHPWKTASHGLGLWLCFWVTHRGIYCLMLCAWLFSRLSLSLIILNMFVVRCNKTW